MGLKNVALKFVKQNFQIPVVYAHCDIPCGIYDPHLAQVAAHTVVRMGTLIQELPALNQESSAAERAAYVNKLSRYITTKEEHAELVKRELRILWADYFKPEHLEKHPDLHTLFWNALKAGSAARQNSTTETGENLLKIVQDIAEIFWETKGATPTRQPSRQPSGGDLVVPS